MKQRNQFLLFFITVWLLPSFGRLTFAQSQDIIYTKSGSIEGPLPILSGGHLVPVNNSAYSTDDVLFGIRSNGDILALDSTGTNYRWIINDDVETHKIFTLQNDIFAAEHIDLINNRVCYQDIFSGRYFVLDKKDVALILYTNGIHKLLAEPEKVAQCLQKIPTIPKYSERQPLSTIELTSEEQEYFSRRALKKTEAFSLYLGIISNHSKDELDQDDAIDQSLKLFVDEERLVEVSSLNNEDSEFYNIVEYLHQIRMMPYTRVELLWNQIAYVNQIKRSEDGTYHGIITVEQLFRGYNSENLVVYQDLTEKNILVVIKPYSQVVDGKEIEKWDVFLSDIGVQSTSKL